MSRAASEEVIAGRAAISVNDPGTDVPEGWFRVRLTDIARLESGHTPSRKHPEWWSGDIPWVSLPDAREHHGGVIHDTTQKTNELGLANSAARLLPKDTVCLSRTASVGYVFRMGRPMATSQDFVNWVCSDALDPRFLQQALLAEGKHLLEFGMGTTHTTIYFPAVLAFHINLAPLPEQRRIVNQVEALLEQVNRAKGRLDRVPLILKRFRQAGLAAACSGELTREWREEHAASAWVRQPLGDLLAEPLSNGRSVPDGDGFPVLRLSALRGGRIDLSQRKSGAWTVKEAARFRVCQGDFLVARGNGSLSLVGRGGLVEVEPDPVAFPDTAIRVRPNVARLSPQFLRIAWDAPVVRAQIEAAAHTSAGIHKVSQGDLEAVELPVPSPGEQREIVRQVEKLFALADAIERRVQAATARADKLPQAILSKAFAGELIPTEAELARAEGRTYETAEDLLKRVSASAPTAGSGTKARRRPTKKPR